MAFKNEYIQEADYEKYDLRRIIGEENPFERGYLFARDWTIDRENNVFLAKIWTHREAEFGGYAFYWKGEWIFFEMRLTGIGKNAPDDSDWTRYLVKGFAVPVSLVSVQQEIIDTFEQALAVYCGVGVYSKRNCTTATAIIDFIGE